MGFFSELTLKVEAAFVMKLIISLLLEYISHGKNMLFE